MTQSIDAAGSPLGPPDDLRLRLLDPARIDDRQARADRLLGSEGAGHLVHDLPVRADGRSASIESRPWRLDPVPVVLDPVTFGWLAAAVGERMEALEAVLADLYGDRSLVQERVVPAEALASTDRYRINALGARPRRWLTSYAVDVALGANGAWHIVQDLTDVPAGLGYALLDRSVMARVVPDLIEAADVASLARYSGAVRRGLAAASGAESPRTVLFSGGIDHPSYIDHSYLAVELGVNLVEGADLVVRRRRVWLRTLDGLEPVDVLFRRLDDPAIDPLEVGARGSAGVPGLLQAVRSGGVALANAHGAGIIESAPMRGHLEAAIAAIRPVTQSLVLFDSPAAALATVPLAPGSTSIGATDAAVVVRLFAVHDGESVSVLPGGTGRVLAPGDDPRAPTACTAKDVWVLGHSSTVAVTPRLPQVDFGRSVPTRAADALYWTNRSAERAEAMARTARAISARIERDPLGRDIDRWARRMARFAAAIRRDFQWEPAATTDLDVLHAELSAVGDQVAAEIGSLLTEATTVREFLSVTTGRVLADLAELRSSLQQHRTGVDDLDAVLADFAAMAGLWQESTVRGPAWTIGDAGRRLERALVVLDLVDATLAGEPDPPEIGAAAIEVLLASTESLVAYRRRYRSEVELDAALQLVLHDESNPRSLAAAVVDLERHARQGDWPVVEELAARAAVALTLPLPELLVEARGAILDAGASVVDRWFSTPVNPIIMRPTGDHR